ncbi:DNA polymerase III subunit delta' [Marinagarivorans algicola]|uniref:DNA polymerase III subunit delta' n=1 Tax=Marinagarivorans algicola TaxID=1513270 RepID=UPI000B092BEA|nr:DNA polymerase III subunit delta' [Marinagarivorans algicola]
MTAQVSFVHPPYPWFFEYWQQFVEQVTTERLPHALLLKGIEGIGAEALATAMAQYLLCRTPIDARSCGHCRGCELLVAGTHPDFIQLVPQEKSHVIKVAQVRELTAILANTAQQGGRKVVLVAPAEMMNVEAANAILKNLEEPANETVFILVAFQSARVLPTIRSRTSQIALPTPRWGDALAWLDGQQVTRSADLLSATGGAPVKALTWFNNKQLEVHDDIAQCLSRGLKGEISPVDVGKKLAAYDLLVVFGLLLLWLQRAIKVQCAQLNDDLPVVQNLAILPAVRLYSVLDTVQGRMAQLYAGSNPNKVLATEELMLIVQGFLAERARRQRQG